MKKSLLHIILPMAVVALSLACTKGSEPVVIDDSDWKYIQTPAFIISAPANWVYVDKHAVNSHEGFLTNYQDSFEFDYSLRADSFEADDSQYNVIHEIIDGKSARILEGIADPHKYGIVFDTATVDTNSVFPLHVDVWGVTLLQTSKNPITARKVLEMFRSVKFG